MHCLRSTDAEDVKLSEFLVVGIPSVAHQLLSLWLLDKTSLSACLFFSPLLILSFFLACTTVTHIGQSFLPPPILFSLILPSRPTMSRNQKALLYTLDFSGKTNDILSPAEEALLEEIFGSLDGAKNHPVVLDILKDETPGSNPNLNCWTVFRKIWSLATVDQPNFHIANNVYHAKQMHDNPVLAGLVSELNDGRKHGQLQSRRVHSNDMSRGQFLSSTQKPQESLTLEASSSSLSQNQTLMTSFHHASAAPVSYSVTYPSSDQPVSMSSSRHTVFSTHAPEVPSFHYDSASSTMDSMSYPSSNSPPIIHNVASGVSGLDSSPSYTPSYPESSSAVSWTGNSDLYQYPDTASSSSFVDQRNTAVVINDAAFGAVGLVSPDLSAPSYPDSSSAAPWTGHYDFSQCSDAALTSPFVDQNDTPANYHLHQYQVPPSINYDASNYVPNSTPSDPAQHPHFSDPYDMYSPDNVNSHWTLWHNGPAA
ncbi:hypothetical protein GYMLUDRAFT_473602 [Collybiopsis luxurians FD-317 M1]|uniref:Uncharacterized protein n=1 Tax=Collybiopsis luxurians FD-317 M1 TaxID=944289 RepID=A0A0D0CU24_9AGAR|nr:hypothetical protein GYMLUDRAFT_473602 [Collybiopsis luxurians FD-317 M1]